MLKKFLRLVLWLVLIVALIGACWLISMNYSWPLWSVPLLFVAACLLLYMGEWSWRKLTAWRLRRKLEHGMSDAPGRKADHRRLDAQWKRGLQALRNTHGGKAQQLPWLMRLNLTPDADDGAPDALAVKRLYAEDGDAALNWLLLRNAVQIDVGADIMQNRPEASDSAWQRLLYRLLRVRRNEPLNGIVLQLSVAWLRQAGDAELLDLGRAARERVDELTSVMNARVPVWVALSGLEDIEGASAWLAHLEPALRQDAFGHTLPPNAEDGASAFLAGSWQGIRKRLFEIRIGQGARSTLPPEVFRFPLELEELEPRLRTLLTPAFEATPYAQGVLLRGLYFTHHGQSENGPAHAFSNGLYEQVLPAQRDGWQPLERWRTTRRLLRTAAVLAWLLCCAGVLALLVHSWRDVNKELDYLAGRPLTTVQFDNADFELDLQNLNSWRESALRLYEHRTPWQRIQPFASHLTELTGHYQGHFARFYRREVLFNELDPLLHDALPVSVASGNAMEIAVWAQHLVRRINLLRAQLNGKPLAKLPLPGPEMDPLFAMRNQHGINLQTGILIGQLYRDYLRWQPDRSYLQSELDTLETALMQLGLGSRGPEWLLAWAEFQGDIQPITLADFWNIRPDPDAPMISAGLTHEGIEAINGFGLEIAQASNDNKLWEQRYKDFVVRFNQIEMEAWMRFLTAFPEARKQLPDENAWKNTLTSLFTNNDPHLRVLRRISAIIEQISVENRPEWASAAAQLEQLFRASHRQTEGVTGLVDKLSLTNVLGSAQVQAYTQGMTTSIAQGLGQMQGSLGMADAMQQYREQINSARQPLLQGNGNAADFAARSWRFGHDPAVAESPLHAAQQQVEQIWAQLSRDTTLHPSLLGILRGPLAYTQEFAARSATCALEREWQSSVVSALQSVDNPQLAEDILYGERGQLSAFLEGQAASFLDRDATRYLPRESLGMSLPLHGQFYAFASRNQLHQVTRAARQIEGERSRKQHELALGDLEHQTAEMEKQLAELRADTLQVRLRSTAPLVNPEARALPRRTRITLQCAQNPQILDNYNFPSQAEFSWNAASCNSTEISVQFADFTLVRKYPGPYGFFQFLEEFSQGRKTFTKRDFPEKVDDMFRAGLEQLTLGWQIEGYQSAIQAGRAIESLDKELAKAKEDALQLRHQMEASATAAPTETGSDVGLSRIPRQISGPCWEPARSLSPAPSAPFMTSVAATPLAPAQQPPAMATPAQTSPAADKSPAQAAGNTAVTPPQPVAKQAASIASAAEFIEQGGEWRIQIGLFAKPDNARKLLDTLGVGFEEIPVTTRSGQTMTGFYSGGYASRDEAQRQAARIEQAMGAKPLLLGPGLN